MLSLPLDVNNNVFVHWSHTGNLCISALMLLIRSTCYNLILLVVLSWRSCEKLCYMQLRQNVVPFKWRWNVFFTHSNSKSKPSGEKNTSSLYILKINTNAVWKKRWNSSNITWTSWFNGYHAWGKKKKFWQQQQVPLQQENMAAN